MLFPTLSGVGWQWVATTSAAAHNWLGNYTLDLFRLESKVNPTPKAFWYNFVCALINTRSMLFLMLNIFSQFLTELWPWSTSEFLCSISCELICGFRSNCVYALLLTRCRFGWMNNIFCSFSTELWPLIDVEILFVLNILWTNWWILIKFCKCIDIDKM